MSLLQQRLSTMFKQFVDSEKASGMVLMGCTILSLLLANSAIGEAYIGVWHRSISGLSLEHWINDGLMALFFLLVGLEIKRELLDGELASPRRASLPIAAALGGMIVPAALYLLIVRGDASAVRGWGVPMATDIAFALGALSIMAPRAPAGLKVLLAALAIVDDMGAVIVIAIFYTGQLVWPAVAAAGAVSVALAALNASGVKRLAPYLVLGIALWIFVHESGVHATIAGVVLAMTIPARTSSRSTAGLSRAVEPEEEAPLVRLERSLHGVSAYLVMPLFAFANAGIELGGQIAAPKAVWGVAVGLALGKPIGITLASWLAVTARLASLPSGVTWAMLHGCAWLGGIGFTMSLFIATLAFDGTPLLASAKAGILTGSAAAGVVGAAALGRATSARRPGASLAS